MKKRTMQLEELYQHMRKNSGNVPLYLIHCPEHIQWQLTKLFKQAQTICFDITGLATNQLYHYYVSQRIIHEMTGNGIPETHLLLNIDDAEKIEYFLHNDFKTISHLIQANANNSSKGLIVIFVQKPHLLQADFGHKDNQFAYSCLHLKSSLLNKNKVKIKEFNTVNVQKYSGMTILN